MKNIQIIFTKWFASVTLLVLGMSHSWAKPMCSGHEEVMFSCQFKQSTQRIAVCASKELQNDSGYIYVAQGTSAKKASRTYLYQQSKSIQLLKAGYLRYAGGTGGYYYSWIERNQKKTIYSVSGDNGFEDQGLLVTSQKSPMKLQKQLRCQPKTVVNDTDVTVDQLGVLGLMRDYNIDQGGLPSK